MKILRMSLVSALLLSVLPAASADDWRTVRQAAEKFPDRDRDGDGFPDLTDRCPDLAESRNGLLDDDGCPDFDTDEDGMIGTADKCPNGREDVDQFQDNDGCPDLDNDGDGVPDTADKCADAKETMNGFRDTDGCPDADSDGDGVDDSEDKCADKPETRNGFEDSDGCPDKIPAQVKRFSGTIKGIVFERGSATIRSRSFKLLDRAAKVLADYPSVRLEIEGHTDNTGGADRNRELSLQRAQSVREYLVGKGIGEDRLTAKGFGPDRPIASNKNAGGRSKNRRVEFTLVNQ